MKKILLMVLLTFNAYGARFLCQPIDQYGFNSEALIVELNDIETEAIVLMEQNGEFLQFPYNKKIVMRPIIAGEDGRWFGNDFDYPGEDYQVFLSTDNKTMRFWVDIWTDAFSGFASAYAENCIVL